MKNIGAKYAIACGVLLAFAFVISYYMGVNPFIEVSHLFFDVVIFGLMIFFALNEFKKTVNGGYLHFWQGMTIGFLVYAISISVYVVFLMAFVFLEEGLLEEYQKQALDYLAQQADLYIEQFGEAQYQGQLEAIEETTNVSLVLSSSVKKFISGLFVTPLISILLRKKPN